MSNQLKQAAINKLSFAAVGRWKTIERVFLGSIYLMKSLDMKLKQKQDCLIFILKGEDNYSGTKNRYGILSRETMSEREQYRKAVGTA